MSSRAVINALLCENYRFALFFFERWSNRGLDSGPGCAICLQGEPVGGLWQHQELPAQGDKPALNTCLTICQANLLAVVNDLWPVKTYIKYKQMWSFVARGDKSKCIKILVFDSSFFCLWETLLTLGPLMKLLLFNHKILPTAPPSGCL